MTRITDHQLEVVARRWRLGSDEAVAESFGLSRSTVRNTLREIRLTLDAVDTMQVTWLLRHELAARATEQSSARRLRKRKGPGGSK